MRTRHLAAVLISASCILAVPSLQSPAMAEEAGPDEVQSSNDAEPIGETLQESWETSSSDAGPTEACDDELETYTPIVIPDDVDESDIVYHEISCF